MLWRFAGRTHLFLRLFRSSLRAQKVATVGHNPRSRFSIKQKYQSMSQAGWIGIGGWQIFQCAILWLLPKRLHHSYFEKKSDNRLNFKKRKNPCEGSFKTSHCETAWWLTVCYSTHLVLLWTKMPFNFFPHISRIHWNSWAVPKPQTNLVPLTYRTYWCPCC